MGLHIQQSDLESNNLPIYSLSQSKTLLVVGLGNPGKEYADNRHNVGFMTLDELASSDQLNWSANKELSSLIAIMKMSDCRLILVKPQTFMNLSGEAVIKVMNYYKLNQSDLICIYDDLDIDFGVIRIRGEGSAGGHNGLKSIIASVGDNFTRLRIGIGPKLPSQINTADFVLQDFSTDQKEILPKIIREAISIIGEASASNLNPETRKVII